MALGKSPCVDNRGLSDKPLPVESQQPIEKSAKIAGVAEKQQGNELGSSRRLAAVLTALAC
jgi:hypothetical protein